MDKMKSRILAHALQVTRRHAGRGMPVVLALVGGLAASFAVAPNTLEQPAQFDTVIESVPTHPRLEPPPPPDRALLHVARIQRNDTIGSLLERLGIQDSELVGYIRTTPLARQFARRLRPGDSISASVSGEGELQTLYLPMQDDQPATAITRSGGTFRMETAAALETREVALRSATVQYSLFAAADEADIPDAIAVQLAEIFASDIDFHRDLRKGDQFSVVFEQRRVRGQIVGTGKILAAEFTHAEGGKTRKAVYFESAAGSGGYYDENGRSLKKAFLRSPLEFSRVTSGFQSSRLHPVLKTWRAHRGVDYGAPIGTKVRATADGVVEFVGRKGGYGNMVEIRHGGRYSTAYAHLNGFASGLHKGSKISQGQTIAYVGQTGLASGPHLHYEFRVSGNQVNPLAMVMPEAPPLNGRSLRDFQPVAGNALSQLKLAEMTEPLPLN